MARDYTLDTEAAKQANTGGKRITESGAYDGKFKAAFYEKNDKGTESINFMFEADSGQEVGPLAIYTHKGDGTPLPGFNAVNAMMTCMKVKALAARPGKVELYDFDSQKMVTKNKEVYPELANKPVGLVLRQEEYTKGNGDVGTRLIVTASYDPATRLMAGEILGHQTEAKSLDTLLEWLGKNPVKRANGGRNTLSGTYTSMQPHDDRNIDDFDI